MSALSSNEKSNQRIALRSVAVPSEHGGWSLTLEPVLLGLLVAPSWPGVLLGVLALLGFLVRTPAKYVFGDRLRGRRTERAQQARKVLGIEVLITLGLGIVIVVLAEHSFIWPLVAAAPLVVVEFWFDVRSRSRRLAPELAGTVAVGSVAASVALLGGTPLLIALGLWLAVAARAFAAVFFVRLQLRRAKQQPFSIPGSDFAQLVAVASMTAGVGLKTTNWVGVIAIAVVAVVHVLLARRPPPSAQMVGAQQVVLGLFVVLTVGLGVLAP